MKSSNDDQGPTIPVAAPVTEASAPPATPAASAPPIDVKQEENAIRQDAANTIHSLLQLPPDQKAQTLMTLQLMLQEGELTTAQQLALTRYPSSISNPDSTFAKIYEQDRTLLGDVNLVRSLLIHPEFNPQTKTSIKNNINAYIKELERDGIIPIAIAEASIPGQQTGTSTPPRRTSEASTPRQQQEELNRHTKSFISRVTKDPRIIGGSAGIALALGIVYGALKIEAYMKDMQESIIRDLDAEIAKNPKKEQIIILEHLNKHLKTSNSEFALERMLPRVTDPKAVTEIFNAAMNAKRLNRYEIKQILPHVTNLEALNAAYKNAIKRKMTTIAESIAKHQQKIFTAELEQAIAKEPAKKQELLSKYLCNNLEIYPNNNAILDKFLPGVTDQRTLGKILLRASNDRNSKFVTKITDRIKELEAKTIASPPQTTPQQATGLLQQPMGTATNSITDHASQNMIAAPGTRTPNSHLPAQTSIPTDANFVMNSMLAVAVVLKMCGMEKFANFSLPPAPIEINFDHLLPTNHWDHQEFGQLLKTNPAAQIIANAVRTEIEQSGTTKWTEKDIKAFVNGTEFEKAMERAKAMEANLRRATKDDFGIEPAKKGTNQATQQQPEAKNKKSHKGR